MPEPLELFDPLAICAKPQFDRVLRYVRGGTPDNRFRLYRFVEDLSCAGLDVGASLHQLRQPLPDLLLGEDKTFMATLETCHCLVENVKTPDGKDIPNPWGGGNLGLGGLAGEQARTNVRDYVFNQAKTLSGYPAFSRVFECNDDWSARGGWDYNEKNLAAFKKKTGLVAPVPQELGKSPRFRSVSGIAQSSGIIDDKDPWLLWNTFLCRDVFGGVNDAARRGAEEGCAGAKIWMLPGGAQVPLFRIGSGLYPPFNFGSAYGLNAIGYYAYYGYWTPTLKYLYDTEMGRMANRGLESWVMPDAGGEARHYIRNQTHLLLAAGVRGINYYCYSWLGQVDGRLEHAELGWLMRRHGALLYRLRPAPKRVGLLVPFSEAIFDTMYGQKAGGLFGALSMAHVDVEPVAEEELDECSHKVIALWRIKHLKQSSVKALERYIQRGGVVLLDKDCAVPINGARRLEISLGSFHNEAYGKLEGIQLLKDTFEFLGAPEFDSPEATTVVRPFTSSDGVKYAYAVQVDTHDEYQFWWKNIYQPGLFNRLPPKSPEEIEAFKREHGMGKYVEDTTLTVQVDQKLLPNGAQVIDVYGGKTLPVGTDKDGRLFVRVPTRKFGGSLLAFLPHALDRVSIKGLVGGQIRTAEKKWWNLFGSSAFEVDRGENLEFKISILDKGGACLPGVQSLEITLTMPDGSVEREIHRYQAAEKGICKVIFTPARNHPSGEWTLVAKELFTGKQSQIQFNLN